MIKVNDIVKVKSINWVNKRHEDKVKCGDIGIVNYLYPRNRYRLLIPTSDGRIVSKVIMEGELEVLENYEEKEKMIELAQPVIRNIERVNQVGYLALVKLITKEIDKYKSEESDESFNNIKMLYDKLNDFDIVMTEELKEVTHNLSILYDSIM